MGDERQYKLETKKMLACVNSAFSSLEMLTEKKFKVLYFINLF